MSAGTLALTNNSDVVPGTGTSFTTDLVSGDFIVATVGGVTYTLPVKSVDSATQITLISKYSGPTQSSVAWSAVPRATQNQITAALVAQTTEALRGQNADKANWQAVFSESGDIVVILPDGSTFSGPSWKKIADLLASIDPVAIQEIADQIRIDAQQVAADRQDVDSKSSQVTADAAQVHADRLQVDAQTPVAVQAATNATAQADRAKTEADRAAQSGVDLVMVDTHLTTYGFVGTTTPVITNLNSILSGASCRFSFAAGATNAPATGYAGEGKQIPLASGGYMQEATLTNGDAYSRSYVNSTFSAWVKSGFNANDITAWAALTLNTGWLLLASGTDAYARAVYRKFMGMLQVQAHVYKTTNGSDGAIIATLPTGFRPSAMYSMTCVANGRQSTVPNFPSRVTVKPDGTITLNNVSEQDGVYIYFSVPLN